MFLSLKTREQTDSSTVTRIKGTRRNHFFFDPRFFGRGDFGGSIEIILTFW